MNALYSYCEFQKSFGELYFVHMMKRFDKEQTPNYQCIVLANVLHHLDLYENQPSMTHW